MAFKLTYFTARSYFRTIALYKMATMMEFLHVLFYLMLNVAVNKFSVMLRRSLRFLGITSTFGECVLLEDTTQRPESGSNPRPLDLESEALTTRPLHPGFATCGLGND